MHMGDFRRHTRIPRGKTPHLIKLKHFYDIEMMHITTFNLCSLKFGRDVALYALGIGACARDAVDADELKYVYHETGQQSIQVCQV